MVVNYLSPWFSCNKVVCFHDRKAILPFATCHCWIGVICVGGESGWRGARIVVGHRKQVSFGKIHCRSNRCIYRWTWYRTVYWTTFTVFPWRILKHTNQRNNGKMNLVVEETKGKSIRADHFLPLSWWQWWWSTSTGWVQQLRVRLVGHSMQRLCTPPLSWAYPLSKNLCTPIFRAIYGSQRSCFSSLKM